jgi:hypothetical protein
MKDYLPIKDVIDVQTSFPTLDPGYFLQRLASCLQLLFSHLRKQEKEIIDAQKLFLKHTAGAGFREFMCLGKTP